jgi:hypothetical protein
LCPKYLLLRENLRRTTCDYRARPGSAAGACPPAGVDSRELSHNFFTTLSIVPAHYHQAALA